MDAYEEQFLVKEIGNQDREWRLNDITMTSNLGEKQAIIDAENERRLTLEKIQKAAARFTKDRAVDTFAIGLEVTSFFEPGFMRRARQRRRHLARISQAEADAQRVAVSECVKQVGRGVTGFESGDLIRLLVSILHRYFSYA